VEEFGEGVAAHRDYAAGEPIERLDQIVSHLAQLKSMLTKAGVEVSKDSTVEISHHHGIRNFPKAGAFILAPPDEPLRKILVFLPDQEHPVHFHEDRNETIRVLHGSLAVEIDGRKALLTKGEEILIPKESWHRFSTAEGAVVEEIADQIGVQSFYRDENIQRLPRHERKTFISLF
jgi:N-acetylneuraminate synthase